MTLTTSNLSSQSAAAGNSETITHKRKYNPKNVNQDGKKVGAHKKIKLDEIFAEALVKAKEAWRKDNNAKTIHAYNTLTPLLTSPIGEAQQELLLQILSLKPTSQDTSKLSDEALVKLNDNLYDQLSKIKVKSESNKQGLDLLTAAVKAQQKTLIEKVVKNLDFSNDDSNTYNCLYCIAQSTPEIAKLTLGKNPRLIFSADPSHNLPTQFFQLSFLHNDLNFFAYLETIPLYNTDAYQEIAQNPRLIDFLKLIIIDGRTSQDLLISLFYYACKAEALENAELIYSKLTDKQNLGDVSDFFIRSVFKKDQRFIRMFWSSNSLCRDPKLLWGVVASGNVSFARKLIKDRGASPQDALGLINLKKNLSSLTPNPSKITLNPLLPLDKKIIKHLIALGANINSANSAGMTLLATLLQGIRPRALKVPGQKIKESGIATWRTNLQESIDWFVENGASLTDKGVNGLSVFANIVGLNDGQLIYHYLPSMKKVGANKFNLALNESFTIALNKCSLDICSLLITQGVLIRKCLINFQEHLTNLIVNTTFNPASSRQPLSKAKFDLLIKGGANPFVKKRDAHLHPLLECCWNGHYKKIAFLSNLEGFNNHFQTSKDGFGIFTYMALGIAIKVENAENDNLIPSSALNLIEDIATRFFLKISPAELNIKDIVCADLILNIFNRYSTQMPNTCKLNPLTHKNINYYEIEYYKQEILNLIIQFCIHRKLDPKKYLSSVQKNFAHFYKVAETDLLICNTDHYRKGLTAYELNEKQKKEVAEVNCHFWLDEMNTKTAISANPTAFKIVLKNFFETIKKRIHKIGVPTVVPEELNSNKTVSDAFLEFEKVSRQFIPNKLYKDVLGAFFKNIKSSIPGNTETQAYFPSLKNSLEHIKKSTHVDIAAHPLVQIFFGNMIIKELFFEQIENRLRVIIHSYLIENKHIRKTASAAAPEAPKYDRASAFTLLSDLHDASYLCASQWISTLISLEDHALKTIQKYDKADQDGISEVPLLEKMVHTVLSEQRKQNIRNWAKLLTENARAELFARSHRSFLSEEQQKNLSENDRNNFVANAQKIELEEILGSEVHYFNAALQNCGEELGIPEISNMNESDAYWSETLKNSLFAFINENSSAKHSIDLVDDAVNKLKTINRNLVVDWMQDNLIGHWQKELYDSQKESIAKKLQITLASLKGIYEGILKGFSENASEKQKQLEEKIFQPIWKQLINEHTVHASNATTLTGPLIQFTAFEDSVRAIIRKGKLFALPDSPLLKTIESACVQSRKAAFAAVLHDEEALNRDEPKFIIKRTKICEMLLKLTVLKQLPVDYSRLISIPVNAPIPANQQAQLQYHALQGQFVLPPLPPFAQIVEQLAYLLPVQQLQLAMQLQQNLQYYVLPLPQIPPMIPFQFNLPPQANQGNLNQLDHQIGFPPMPPLPAAGLPAQAPPLHYPYVYRQNEHDMKDER